MRVLLLTCGSRGDVQPFVGLGVGLAARGHEVRVATQATYEAFVRERGLDFAPLSGDPQALIASPLGQQVLATGANAGALMRGLAELLAAAAPEALRETLSASEGMDAVVCANLALTGHQVAEALGIPSFVAPLNPSTPTRHRPSSFLPPRPDWGPTNWLGHHLVRELFWRAHRETVAGWRRKLGLPPLPRLAARAFALRRGRPVLHGYSALVSPRPPDWAPTDHVTGYWFLDAPAGWGPSPALERFLAAGEAPVYVGFGSMAGGDPEGTTRAVLAALQGRRAILAAGWGGLGARALPDTVHLLDEAPHDWLFPRMAAVVHHGGAGTTAAAIRAGVPMVVCPVFGDQPYWGRRAEALGVAPRAIPKRELEAGRLAAALRATEDPGVRDRAARLGEAIRAEAGPTRAAEVLEAEQASFRR